MWLLCLLLMWTGADSKPAATEKAASGTVSLSVSGPAPIPASIPTTLTPLTQVHRIYIEILTGGESALKIRDMLMTSLQQSKLFIITEDENRADAVLKGAADDTPYTESFQSSEGINARTQLSTPSSSQSSSSRYSNRATAAMSIGENESRRSEERKHEAIATVRLVTKDGDVIWSTTQESLGAKFMGAAADVADKVSKRLVADYKKEKLGLAQ